MKIIDNFLPLEYQNAIEGLLLSADFPWYLNAETVGEYEKNTYSMENSIETQQFTHGFLREGHITSDSYQLISLISYHLMLTENINTTCPRKIKANLNIAERDFVEHKHFPIHTDLALDKEATTVIYYVNDADGDTLLFDELGKTEITRVSPKKGRLVYFDSKIPHAGCPPRKVKNRCVINFNFLKVK